MPGIFDIADDHLQTGFDEEGKDHDKTLDKVIWVCRKANVKLFRCNSIPFFGKAISQGVSLELGKV